MPNYRGSLLWSKPLCCPPPARTGVVGHNIDRCIIRHIRHFEGVNSLTLMVNYRH